MANMFALILAIATLITGIIWCVDRFKLAPARRARQAELAAADGDVAIDKTLREKVKQPGWVETCASIFRCCWWSLSFVRLFMSRFRSHPAP